MPSQSISRQTGAARGQAANEDSPAWGWSVAIMAVTSAGFFYFAPWPAAYLPALIVFAASVWLRPDFGLAVVTLAAPFFMLPKSVGSHQVAPSEIFLGVDATVVALWAFRKHTAMSWNALARSPFVVPGLGLLLGAILSTVTATDRHHALQWCVELVVEPLLFFALLLLLIKDEKGWRLQLSAVVGAGLLVGAIGVVQLLTHQDLSRLPGTSFDRVQALYGSPDNLGLLYDRVIPLWLSFALLYPLRSRRWMTLLAAGLLLFVVLYFTYSRGAWIAVLLICVCMLALTYRRARWLAVALFVLALLAVGAKGSALAHAFRSGHANTMQRRIDLWQSSADMLKRHPLLGVGPDNFVHYYAPSSGKYLPCPYGLGYVKTDALSEPCQSHPHNEILDFWLSSGVIGLVSFVSIEVVFWVSAWRIWTRSRGTVTGLLMLGVMGSMATSILHGLVDNSYFLVDLSLIFWLLCGSVSFVATSHPGMRERLP